MKIQPKLCALLLVVFVFGPIKISCKINLMSSHNWDAINERGNAGIKAI